jgi:uncharacterized protein YbcI
MSRDAGSIPAASTDSSRQRDLSRQPTTTSWVVSFLGSLLANASAFTSSLFVGNVGVCNSSDKCSKEYGFSPIGSEGWPRSKDAVDRRAGKCWQSDEAAILGNMAEKPYTSLLRSCDHEDTGEIEAAISEGISRFEQDYMGRGPKHVHASLIGDLLVVRLIGVLTVAEQQLGKSLPAGKGRDLLKQARTHLIHAARPVTEAMVENVTGSKVVSLHHDISTTTGEEVVLFTLAESPLFREAKSRH